MMAEFTLVYDGDISSFSFNPMTKKTAYGVPYAVGVGDAFDKIDRLECLMERAVVQIQNGDFDGAIETLTEDV